MVTTASTGGLVGFRGVPLYCAAKHAVIGLTKAAALEYAGSNVRINCVAPGAVDTPMLARFVQGRTEVKAQLAAAHPIGRIAGPEEIAEGLLWLVSERAGYVTGQVLAIDGGYSAM